MKHHQTFHVGRQSTLVAELASLAGLFRAPISLGPATGVDREVRDVGRSGARGDALDRFRRYKTGADTWTTTGQTSQSSDTSVRRRPLSSTDGACQEHWCGNSSHSVATLWPRADGADRHRSETAGNVGIEREAEGPFRGFRCMWNPIRQVLPSLARHRSAWATNTLDAGKLFHVVIMRIERVRGERSPGHSGEQARQRPRQEWTEGVVAESSTLPTGSRRESKLRTLRRWLVLSTSWQK